MTGRALTTMMSDRRPSPVLALHRKTQKYLGLTAASARGGAVVLLRFGAILALTLGLLWGEGGARAEGHRPSPPEAAGEYLVKAAFLYNFAKFTDWPDEAFADAAAPLRICALGDAAFGPAMASIEGRQIRGRRVEAARLESYEQAEGCQLVYIGAGERGHLREILERLEGRPVLTVTEMPAVGEPPGGMIHLMVVAQKIRFHIEAAVARSAGLSFSSKLLALSEGRPGKALPTAAGPESSERPNG